MTFSLSKPTRISQIAAITAIMVSGLGKTLHLHQQCECGNPACDVQSVQTSTCPYGCESCSFSDRTEPPEGESPKPQHNEHECAVCQVLAQAPNACAIAQTPEVVQAARIPPATSWISNVTGLRIQLLSRGPPAVAFPAA